jgi:hypothetical protein
VTAAIGRVPLHVVVPTHTTRYLALVLAALAAQTRRADTIVVSCDNDDPAIGAEIQRCATQFSLPVHWVRRVHHGVERLCQVRNNAVRHIATDLGARSGRVIILDGDMLATPTCLALHEQQGQRAQLVYPYRVDVPRDISESLNPDQVAAGDSGLALTPDARAALHTRQRRYQRQLFMRRLRLGPLHKPKLLGGHFSCDLALFLQLNGFDELYQGWGFKDDEFARRAARLGATCAVAVSDIIAFHLWHQTRQPAAPMNQNPNYARFLRTDLPIRAEHGVDNPLPQNPISATFFGG